MTAAVRVTVAVLTYRRSAELAACLPLVAAQLAVAMTTGVAGRAVLASILVIDNDAEASARPVVTGISAATPIAVDYVVEPRPGIAAARNRALDAAGDTDLLVFLDDDERPTDAWLSPLIETWSTTGAAAVMGRVVSVFPSRPDPWVEAGEFFRRRRLATGTSIEVGAAGNLLLDLPAVRRLGVRFDERLGLGAGEDSLFTRRLVGAGGLMVWCDESVATDHVPVERMTRRWVLERARSHGNTEAVVELLLAHGPRQRAIVRVRSGIRGAVRVVAGCARFAVGVVLRSLRHQARGLRTAYRGIGIASAALGVEVKEYAREHETRQVPAHG